MQEIVESIRTIARAEVTQQWPPALGVVSSVHTGNGVPELTCTVELRESGIVLPHVPIAVGTIGVASPPVEGDLVLVAFAGGRLEAPIVLGRLYDEKVDSPTNRPGQVVAWLPHAETDSTKRLEVTLDTPDGGPRTLTIGLDGDPAVTITVTDGSVSLTAGEASVKVSQSSSSDGAVEVVAGDAKLTLKQSGDISVEASGKLKLSGNDIEISGQSEVKIAGQTIKLN
jgi:uncharacterized protein involved in type VI secretion and phage assembly